MKHFPLKLVTLIHKSLFDFECILLNGDRVLISVII